MVIIPDGKLYYTPFEALVSPSREREFHRQKYLVQKFDIRYHYSATLFCESKAAHTTPEFDFLGYAPIFPDSVKTASSPFIDSLLWSVSREVSVDGKKFSYLPGTEKEITTIVRFFLDQKKQAKGFYYNEASESSLKSMASKTRILHVATHGLMNESTPKLSGIILTVPDTTTLIDDGILYASETYNLRLNADLVVLSSCESGIGKLQKGEGLMAIGRGFLFSGANNLLYSLWKVDDRSTTMMMENFYSQILNQSSYANALRQAKLKMIENPKTAFPKNWAGFVIFGK